MKSICDGKHFSYSISYVTATFHLKRTLEQMLEKKNVQTSCQTYLVMCYMLVLDTVMEQVSCIINM